MHRTFVGVVYTRTRSAQRTADAKVASSCPAVGSTGEEMKMISVLMMGNAAGPTSPDTTARSDGLHE
jgi:hypothetical protein